MKYAAPGETNVKVTVYNLPTGLTGTLGARIMAGTTEVQARTTTGIVEIVAGLGAYQLTIAAAPTTRGTYQVLFDDGSGTPAGTAVVDLEVTTSAPAAGPTGGDLTTLAAVKEQMEAAGISSADDVIETLITAASQALVTYTGRTIPLEDGAADRYFDVADAWDDRRRELWVWDLSATPTEVELLDAAGDAVAGAITLADDVVLVPRNRAAWQPVERLRLRASAATPRLGQEFRVRGIWGWPAIPTDVEQACIVTVRSWLRAAPSSVGEYDTGFGTAAVPVPAGGWMLPMTAKQLLTNFRRKGVA